MSDVFKAIADSTRRAILLMLVENPENINSIADKFKMSRPAVSKHIKILAENNLVKIESDNTDGRQKNCYIQLEALKEVNDYLYKLEEYWTNKLDGLDTFLAKKEKNCG